MGYQKFKEPLTLKDYIKMGISVFIIIFMFGVLLNFFVNMENESARKQKIIEARYVEPDTLIISKDLRSESNITKFVNENYPNYIMLEYKHIDSEYSAWNGTHNFYEFKLIKK